MMTMTTISMKQIFVKNLYLKNVVKKTRKKNKKEIRGKLIMVLMTTKVDYSREKLVTITKMYLSMMTLTKILRNQSLEHLSSMTVMEIQSKSVQSKNLLSMYF